MAKGSGDRKRFAGGIPVGGKGSVQVVVGGRGRQSGGAALRQDGSDERGIDMADTQAGWYDDGTGTQRAREGYESI